MEEENKTNMNKNNNSDNLSDKTKKNNSKNSNNNGSKFQSFISKYNGEFKKISWPTRDELIKQTITVIIVSLLVGGIIFCMDFVLSSGVKYLSGIL